MCSQFRGPLYVFASEACCRWAEPASKGLAGCKHEHVVHCMRAPSQRSKEGLKSSPGSACQTICSLWDWIQQRKGYLLLIPTVMNRWNFSHLEDCLFLFPTVGPVRLVKVLGKESGHVYPEWESGGEEKEEWRVVEWKRNGREKESERRDQVKVLHLAFLFK